MTPKGTSWAMLPVLATALLLGLGSPTLPAAAELENLALQRPWICSDEVLPGWTGLTDGVSDSDQAPACFATANGAQFPKQIVVDLGAVCLVSRLVLYNSANGNTRHVELWTSADAANFEKLREYYFPGDKLQPLTHNFTPRQVRYVKVVLHDSWQTGAQGANCLFLRELQVFGERPAGGLVASGQGELRLARLQGTVVTTPAVAVFRRYGLTGGRMLRLGVLGDSFAAATEGQPSPWPDALADLAAAAAGPGQAEVLNLAAAGQTPQEGEQLLGPLEGEMAADVVLIAYGKDAALAGQDPVAFRNAWQKLVELVQRRVPALVVAVTPPPLWQENGAGSPSTQPMAAVVEQAAALAGVPLVRSGAALAAATPAAGAFSGSSELSLAGAQLVARAVYALLWGED